MQDMDADKFRPLSGFLPAQKLKWLFLDLDSYFASVEQQHDPSLRERPIIVVPALTDTTCAIAASYQAKAYGIKTGTKVFDAKRLCPDLVCVPAKHGLYTQYHHRIFRELHRHIPITHIHSIDEGSCRLSPSDIAHPTAIFDLIARIKAGISAHIGSYITCSIGVAANRLLAKMASDMQKPNGHTILYPDTYRSVLYGLTLRDIPGINKRMEARLNRAGVISIAQYCALAPKQARQVWGSVEGERLWYILNGYDCDPHKPGQKLVDTKRIKDDERNRSNIGHSKVLDPLHRRPDKARVISQNLLERAVTRMRSMDLFARKLSLSISLVNKTSWQHQLTFTPKQDHVVLMQYHNQIWDQLVAGIQAMNRQNNQHHAPAILKIGVNLSDLYEAKDVTGDLFADMSEPSNQDRPNQGKLKDHGQNDQISQVMDAIKRRHGRDAIYMGRCL